MKVPLVVLSCLACYSIAFGRPSQESESPDDCSMLQVNRDVKVSKTQVQQLRNSPVSQEGQENGPSSVNQLHLTQKDYLEEVELLSMSSAMKVHYLEEVELLSMGSVMKALTVPKFLLGLVYFIITVSLVSQLWAIFVNKTWCAGGNGLPPANIISLANPDEDVDAVWAVTPPACKYMALQNPGWAVCTMIVWYTMPLIFSPGSVTTICKSVAIVCIVQQCVWLGACWGKVDASEKYKRTFCTYFTQTTAQEIFILGASSAYLGFFATASETGTKASMCCMDWVRFAVVLFMVVALVLQYGSTTFFNHEKYAVLGIPNPEDEEAAGVWARTPSACKISCLRAGAWCLSMQATSIVILATLDPGMIKGLCKAVSLTMIFWQFVWYLGMLGKIDDVAFRLSGPFVSTYTRQWRDYFYKETWPIEICFFLLYFVIGFIL